MKCPHCFKHIHASQKKIYIDEDGTGSYGIEYYSCPGCYSLVIMLIVGEADIFKDKEIISFRIDHSRMIHPIGHNRPPVSPYVPKEIAEDYEEACVILQFSAKASAALARRCLQHVLREKGNVKKGRLVDEIDQMIEDGNLPSDILEDLHTLRKMGNLGAHVRKDTKTGEIVPVDPDEADFSLDVIENLFDFYYTRPAKRKEKREAFEKKIA